MRVLLDVDTGTDDAGALWCAVTHPDIEVVAVTASWGNSSCDQVVRNTLAVLAAVGARDVPVHAGAKGPLGPALTEEGAEMVMGSDGLGDVGVEPPPDAAPSGEPAGEAIARLANERPGELTLFALAPLSNVANALDLEPDLPKLLAGLVVMGGAVAVGGNVTPVAEAKIAHDPESAARVVRAFGRAGRSRPKLVPLDATLRAPLTRDELDVVERSSLPGAATIYRIWSSIWSSGVLELGRAADEWPCHDLLALWAAIDPGCFTWTSGPLAVDTGRSAAWGATVHDRRGLTDGPVWDVAMRADPVRYRSGVRAWLQGRAAPP
jgi:purine nucleosidase